MLPYVISDNARLDIGLKEASLMVQQASRLTPQLRQELRSVVCEKWPNYFPISNWCAYDQVINQKQRTFFDRFRNEIVTGNEVNFLDFFAKQLFDLVFSDK